MSTTSQHPSRAFGQFPCDDGVVAGSDAAAPCAPATGRWVLAATILGSSLVFIDGTVVYVALPALQRDLDATGAAAQWIVEAYALLLATLLLVGGAAGDRFGRRRVFALGVGRFTLASLGCALAPDVATLIAARAAQGVGGALRVPGSLAIISASFVGEVRGRAIGIGSGYTAALGIVMTQVFRRELEQRLARIQAPAEALSAIAAQRAKLGAIEVPGDIAGTMRPAVHAAVAEAFVAGFRWVMGTGAALALAASIVAWLTIGGTRTGSAPEPIPHAADRSTVG